MSDEHPSQRIIQAAIGYCELGMWEIAWEELETLEPEVRALPKVLRLRLDILIALKRYESAAILAESLVARGDAKPAVWLHGAYAIRRSRSLAEARKFLLRGESVLKNDATVQYNLACYETQLGDIDSAKVGLFRAFELDPKLRLMALDDEDLTPFW